MLKWLGRFFGEPDPGKIFGTAEYHRNMYAMHGNTADGILHLWKARDLEKESGEPPKNSRPSAQ